MHDTTRRIICRTLFCAVCIVPTLGVLSWLGLRQMPGHVTLYAEKLSQDIGMSASMTDVSYPRPNAIRIAGLQLDHPETGERIVYARRLVVVRRDGEFVVKIDGGVLADSGPALLGEIVFDQILKRWENQMIPIHLVATDLSLQTDETTHHFRHCAALLSSATEGPCVKIEFRLGHQGNGPPISLQMSRHRNVRPPVTQLKIDTRGNRLPNQLLSHCFPRLLALGKNCHFQGAGWLTNDVAGWHADWSGLLTQVDLGRLFDGLPHQLSGLADISIMGARLHENRITELAGSASVTGSGTLSRSLLEACVRQLGCSMNPPVASQMFDEVVPFQELSIAFRIDEAGLYVRGQCHHHSQGTMMQGERGLRVGEPPNQPLAVTDLLKALVPASNVLVPATRETDALLRLLPVPPMMATRLTDDVPIR